MSIDDEYVDRNAEYYEKENSQSIESSKEVTPNKGKPWRRFWARFLDSGIHMVPVAFAFEKISPGNIATTIEKYGQYSLSMKLLPFVLIFEVIVLSIFGTTLGKFLLNIKLSDSGDNRISFPAALLRTFLLWIKGLAFGFPLVSMLTAGYAAGVIRKNGTASWDDSNGIKVTYGELSGVKTVFAILLIFGFVILNGVGNMK